MAEAEHADEDQMPEDRQIAGFLLAGHLPRVRQHAHLRLRARQATQVAHIRPG